MLFEAEVKGNQCLFTLFVLSNLCLGLVGCGTTFAGYYVTRENNAFRWDSGSFVVFGVVLVFLAFLGFCSRRSSGALLCYILSSLVLLGGQVGFTLAIIATPDYVNLLGTTQANIVRYSLLGACGLIFLCMVIAWCYRRTLQSARKDFENPNIKGYNPLNRDKEDDQDPFGMVNMKLHSPLGNPQATKILVVAKLCGAEVEFPPFDPAILKSKDFGAKSPLKKLPLLETPTGAIAEADAAMRYLARSHSHSLYNGSAEELAEVDTWLDICKSELEHGIGMWVGAVLGHAYNPQDLAHATGEVKKVLFALEARLKVKHFIALEHLTLADIAFATTLQHAYRLVFDEKFRKPLAHVNAWFTTVTNLPEFTAVAGKQHLCVAELKPLAPAAPAEEAKKPAKKEESKKEETKSKPKPKDDDEDEDEHQEKKAPNPLDLLPPSTFVLDDWKRLYANTKNKHEVIATFWEKYEDNGWSIWTLKYQKAEGEGEVLYMTNNLLSGFIQRLDHFRRYSFGSFGVYGDEPSLEIQGVLMWRGHELTQELKDHPSFEYYERTRVDPANAEHRAVVEEFWCNNQENELVQGRKVREWRSFL